MDGWSLSITDVPSYQFRDNAQTNGYARSSGSVRLNMEKYLNGERKMIYVDKEMKVIYIYIYIYIYICVCVLL